MRAGWRRSSQHLPPPPMAGQRGRGDPGDGPPPRPTHAADEPTVVSLTSALCQLAANGSGAVLALQQNNGLWGWEEGPLGRVSLFSPVFACVFSHHFAQTHRRTTKTKCIAKNKCLAACVCFAWFRLQRLVISTVLTLYFVPSLNFLFTKLFRCVPI